MSRNVFVLSALALALVACSGGDDRNNNDNNTTDSDGDGKVDSADNCPATPNANQNDSDSDGVGDLCDNCQYLKNQGQEDADNDGDGDLCDNCKNTPNDNQADNDGDHIGNACDNCPNAPNANQTDGDTDGTGDACEGGCSGALDLELGTPADGTIDEPATKKHYYRFSGNQGDALLILTAAKPEDDPFSDEYLDTVVTLYNEDGTVQLARNDDSPQGDTNDSFLLTMLPATATYCLEVAECTAVLGADSCSPVENITDKTYRVAADVIGEDTYTKESEPNDAGGQATALAFEKNPQTGRYYLGMVAGTFATPADKDLFKFTAPADVVTTGSRLEINVLGSVGGANGNGSTADQVVVTIAAAASPDAAIAKMEADLGQTISCPVEPSTEYVMTISRAGGTTGANDFYFFDIGPSGGNPMETEPNNDVGTAQALTASTSGGFFIQGDLPASDADYFSIALPTGQRKITGACGGQVNGSGLRGLTMELLKPDGTALGTGTSAVEDPEDGIYLRNIAVPAGVNTVLVKISATSQDANVSGRFYLCGFRTAT